ncbi:alpha-tocopherol transfer protein-like [Thrips palmi]|uniref:Alpha-tocopherol transfer protein-like n=1 Tax=Thrips palmi TaxID=161013 RepID=A0A6P8ZRZ1_THRPL|nr:alpha-tocopherol transfer protein-like [Thrips palmi]
MPSAVQSLSPVQGEMSPEELKNLLAEIGTTSENLKRDSVALREWVNSQPHLPDLTSEYDEWLETFLLVAKNSMEKAKTRLDNYFTTRTVLDEWFTMPPAPEDQLIIDERDFELNGWQPRVLPNGCVLFIMKPMNTGNWSQVDMKVHYHRIVLHIDALMGLSKKLRGAILIMDEKHANLNIVTTFLGAIGHFRRAINCIQDCMPLRVHSVHFVNTLAPNMQKMILNAVTPLLKGKLAQRISIHEDMKSLHEHIPVEYLPQEYGGTAPEKLEDMATSLSNFIAANKDWYVSRTWMKTNEDRRVEKKVIGSDSGVEGSFRKLTVD